jgi:hypothetical protein
LEQNRVDKSVIPELMLDFNESSRIRDCDNPLPAPVSLASFDFSPDAKVRLCADALLDERCRRVFAVWHLHSWLVCGRYGGRNWFEHDDRGEEEEPQESGGRFEQTRMRVPFALLS